MTTFQDNAISIQLNIEGHDPLLVLDFTGDMALSQLYEFDIECLAKSVIDDTSIFYKKVQLTWQTGTTSRTIYGLVDQWQLQDNDLGLAGYYHYRCKLVPCVKRLTQTVRLATYLNQSLPDIIQGLLAQHHIQVRFDLHKNYLPKAFVCQFHESDWHFIQRWLERLGLFFYFNQDQNQETLVITDTNSTLQQDSTIQQLLYKPDPSQAPNQNQARLWHLACRRQPNPQKLQVIAYDPNKASQKISTEVMIDPQGQGAVKVWQEDLLSDSEIKAYGQTLATIYQWQSQVFTGSVDCSLLPGTYVNIENTYQKAWNNQDYLIIKAHYVVSQRQAILANFFDTDPQAEAKTLYECQFEAIFLKQAYCAPCLTPTPRIQGLIPAFIIDSTNSNVEIPINAQGCYQVAFSADSDTQTCWLRMCQAYTGDNFGLMGPLHTGTEVMLGFLYGNPDLPTIVSAMFNSTHQSVFQQNNSYQSGFASANNNRLVFVDQPNGNSIVLSSPDGSTSFTLGSNNGLAPPSPSVLGKGTTSSSNTAGSSPSSTSSVSSDATSNSSNSTSSTSSSNSGSSSSSSSSSSGTSLWTYGNSYSYVCGSSFSVTEGGSNSITLGDFIGSVVGAKVDNVEGLWLGSCLAIKADFNYAGKMDYSAGFDLKQSLFHAHTATTSITQTVAPSVFTITPATISLMTTPTITLSAAALVEAAAPAITLTCGSTLITLGVTGINIESAAPVSVKASQVSITAPTTSFTGAVTISTDLTVTGALTVSGTTTLNGDVNGTGINNLMEVMAGG